MANEITAAIYGGISGAIASAVCCYILDKRKEYLSNKKNKQTRKDAISFIESLNQYSGKENKYLAVLQELGCYRIFNMSPILEKVGIASFKKDINGNYIPLFQKGFYDYSKKELKNITRDITNSKYE